MAEYNEEEIDELFVPQNTDYDINAGGYTFETKRAIEGLIIGGTIGVLVFAFFSLIGIKFTIKVALTALFAGGGFIFAIVGVNGDSISDYILNILIFKKKNRITYYNPRVKHEIKFFVNEISEDETMIPRERLEAMWHKYITKQDTIRGANNFKEEDNTVIYFEDDIDYLGKPEDLMSPSEKRRVKKEKKKQEKLKAKAEAKQRKINKKNRKAEEHF